MGGVGLISLLFILFIYFCVCKFAHFKELWMHFSKCVLLRGHSEPPPAAGATVQGSLHICSDTPLPPVPSAHWTFPARLALAPTPATCNDGIPKAMSALGGAAVVVYGWGGGVSLRQGLSPSGWGSEPHRRP